MEGLVEGEPSPLIKPQKYELVFVKYETALMYGRAPKLVLWFRIVTMGEAHGKILPRYYNVKRIIGRPAKNGDFKVGWKSDFLREFVTLFSVVNRPDRVPMSRFEDVIIIGKVTTVTRNQKQRLIPEALQYSVISELEKVKLI